MSILSFAASVRYEKAQIASMSVSSSEHCRMIDETRGITLLATSLLTVGFPLQQFDKDHTVFLNSEREAGCWTLASNGSRAPASSTRSLNSAQSPAILPKHHADCSRTSALGEETSFARCGIAPACTTARVYSVEAMLVNAHAASNCNSVDSVCFRHSTSGAMAPHSTHAVAGGSSMDNSFLIFCAALNLSYNDSSLRFITSWGISFTVGAASGPASFLSAPGNVLFLATTARRLFNRSSLFFFSLNLRPSPLAAVLRCSHQHPV
mmetsp:Transcript_30994/g.54386  ORF Transcript_30994/g.54386 Transcript_30994/m.54386 type:complete len:265 (-) Transcript_30994:215-1009(-)